MNKTSKNVIFMVKELVDCFLKCSKRVLNVDLRLTALVHAFKHQSPDKPHPSTPTGYRYIDQGHLETKNINLF
ncbi:hypothetical protein [Liquorilactobacillus sicerae]|uniref:hypothetical protein n=1 Tax=Liquorilactobacillus sicerae TaxID=1416943 RepID=UPI00247FCF7A|nr:hypothetical protein [Liquorilactobacillus sicerae]